MGLGAAMPTGPGVIDERAIAEVARGVPPPIATFLLTSAVTADEIVDQQRRCGTSTVQLVAGVDPCVHEQLRKRMLSIGLVQVIHVMGAGSLHEALEVSPRVDAILLDSGNPTLAVKELGGTGRVHDWSVSRTIREQVDVPVFLAGGLTVANVGDAIEAVGPFALDLCSGVRTNDELDRAKLGAFMASVRKVEVGSSRSSPERAVNPEA